jgi:SulP family sulfate permease
MIAILEAHRAGLFSARHWSKNILAGVIVGFVALPLAMAFAIASGAKPEQGLYTAIVAGLVTSLFGGSRLQISGPTGAFIVILAGITAKYGITGLQVATLLAGIMLLAMGLARVGSAIKYIPDPVIVGFTTGIAVIIWVGQWQDFFGLAVQGRPEHFHEKLLLLLSALPSAHLPTLGLGVFALAVLIVSPRLLKSVPGPLVALVLATSAQAFLQFEGVGTIGSVFGGIPQSLPAFAVPAFGFADVLKLIGPAFTIALLGAIESLLSAVVADGMAGTRHDSNQELIGQGLANIVAPLFGGFAATGAIARTATNIRNGATSPLAGVVHVVTLVLIVLALAPLAAYIPLCALGAILFVVAWNMSELPHFLHLATKAPRADVSVLLLTFFFTVFADLVVAVNVGVIVAALLFMRRMSHAVEIQADSETHTDTDGSELAVPPNTMVYSIDGPFFFGAAEKLERTLEGMHSHINTVILRMDRVPFVDATGIQTLADVVEGYQHQGSRVVIVGLRRNVIKKLVKAGLIAQLGERNLHDSLGDFLRQSGADGLATA